MSVRRPSDQPGIARGWAPLDSGLLVPRAHLPQIAGLLHNLSSTTTPTVNDDANDGYGVGSTWIDTTGPFHVWTCVDATVGAAVWKCTSLVTATFGPFFTDNLEGSANSDLTPMFFTADTTVSKAAGGGLRSPAAGEIIAAWIISNGSRTGGTATLKFLLGGVENDFASNACKLDASNTDRIVTYVPPGSGLSVSGGSTMQPRLVTSGWTPTTADLSVYFLFAFAQ